MLDLTARIADHAKREERRAELDRRDREHGGLTPHDRATEEQRRSVAGWGPYRPSVTVQEARHAATLRDDIGRVPMRRLWADCATATRRWCKGAKSERAASIRNDALLLLARWETQGTNPALDLGGYNGRPLRRDWETIAARADDGTRERQLTPLAWRALHAAVKQASESPAMRAELKQEDTETPSGSGIDVAGKVYAQQRETGAPIHVPDPADAPILAECLDCPLDAARAILARFYKRATVRALADVWGIAPQSASNAIHRGQTYIAQRWPDPKTLLDALDAARETYRVRSESAAILTLLRYRDGEASALEAREAVEEYRATHAEPSSVTAALHAAARAAILRRCVATGAAASPERVAELSERVSASVRRIMAAEQRRGYTVAARAEHGFTRSYTTLSMAPATRSAATVSAQTRAARVWTYGLTARDDRATRV